MDEDDGNSASTLSFYRRKKANKRAADEDVEELYSQQNQVIPISKKNNDKVYTECRYIWKTWIHPCFCFEPFIFSNNYPSQLKRNQLPRQRESIQRFQ